MAILTEHLFELCDSSDKLNTVNHENTNQLMIIRVQIGHHLYVEVDTLHTMGKYLKVHFFDKIVEFRGTLFIKELLRLAFNCV